MGPRTPSERCYLTARARDYLVALPVAAVCGTFRYDRIARLPACPRWCVGVVAIGHRITPVVAGCELLELDGGPAKVDRRLVTVALPVWGRALAVAIAFDQVLDVVEIDRESAADSAVPGAVPFRQSVTGVARLGTLPAYALDLEHLLPQEKRENMLELIRFTSGGTD